jgi:predicted DNA-binding transcriptional regulator AlpA
MSPMTEAELRSLPPTIDLPTAARALGCGRTLAYTLARRGRFPCRVLRLGHRYLVPTADLLDLLGLTTADHPTEHDVAAARPTQSARDERSSP